jgi:hypothetical protein
MATPIYKGFLARLTEAWYALSPEEQEIIIRKVDEAREAVGGKTVILCDSSWSSEEWPTFGIEVFPSIEALQKHTVMLTDANWYRYVESISLLGIDPASYKDLIP